jgi:hypothetical protein
MIVVAGGLPAAAEQVRDADLVWLIPAVGAETVSPRAILSPIPRVPPVTTAVFSADRTKS